MIKSKEELAYYMECDRVALGITRTKPKFIGDEIWKFERLMRQLDYATSTKNKVKSIILKYKYRNLGMKLGFSIPCNVFGAGLAIVHYGNIIVSGGAKIGDNCRIHSGVNIGANAGESKAATIGDNVYIGPGAKIVGDISIGNDVCIGANAVVVKDVENGITVGGIPAKKISDNGSEKHLKKATEEVKQRRNK